MLSVTELKFLKAIRMTNVVEATIGLMLFTSKKINNDDVA